MFGGGGAVGWWAYIREKKHFKLQSIKLITFLCFFHYKTRISAYCTSCKMWNMFKINNKGTRIRKVNDKVISKRTGIRKVNDIFNNRDTVDVVLVSLLLTLNTFHFLLQCFYCWLWSVICGLGLLLGVLTQKLGKWRNLVNKSHKNTWYV